ncbi:MAG: hypothetical protein KDB98_04930 [Flavobacteriales bacterium]|nr:hypothetical protein [Flavobacteriales bacterium]
MDLPNKHHLATDAQICTEGFSENRMNILLVRIPVFMALRLTLPFTFFLFFFFISPAQQRENKKIKFLAKVETRNSFVQTHHATFLGVRAGFEFKFPVRCGIGYYWMLTNLDSKFYKPSDFGQTDPTAQPRMRYAMGYVDYSFYEEDDWTLSVPVQIGVGETFYRSSESNRFANGLVVPMEAGIAVDYLFTRWVGFGVGLGYRVMLKGNKQVKENFNSPYYQIRLNILFTEIFRGLKKKKKDQL